MSAFKGKHLFWLTCQSIQLIKSSARNSQYSSAIGFGAFPTDIKEIEAHRKLKSYTVSQRQIDEYKRFLVRLASNSIVYALKNGYSVETLFFRMRLLINREINSAILSSRNSTFADLLHFMKLDTDYF